MFPTPFAATRHDWRRREPAGKFRDKFRKSKLKIKARSQRLEAVVVFVYGKLGRSVFGNGLSVKIKSYLLNMKIYWDKPAVFTSAQKFD
ncbi:MAG TPA: hypothetical protein VF556_07530 [Pyrinomonadaceae bacterium]|jgi:hypothetical protein